MREESLLTERQGCEKLKQSEVTETSTPQANKRHKNRGTEGETRMKQKER
jgi:hypothetical protein